MTVGDANGTGGRADVWLVRYDPAIEQVDIARGKNEGRTLPHRNVVKELLNLGRWDGTAESFAIPPAATRGLSQKWKYHLGYGVLTSFVFRTWKIRTLSWVEA